MRRDIIVIGASAGGVEALSKLMGCLPENLPAALFITLHLPPFRESYLPDILAREGNLESKHPEPLERVRQSVVYVAPPDFHLLLEKDRIRLSHGPKENRHRPAIDVLFRSAARAYGRRVAGVLLTGNLDDGVAGLVEIKNRGGLVLVQDPEEAAFPQMPGRALDSVEVDRCLRLIDLGRELAKIATGDKVLVRVKNNRKIRPSGRQPDLVASNLRGDR